MSEKTNLDILLSYLNGKPVSLEVRSLCKSFGGHRVLDDVNLKVAAGEIFFLIGRSGSGKTILLRHISGLEVPEKGEILIDSEPLEDTKTTISLVFQSSALFNSMTVKENVEIFIREHRVLYDEQKIAEISSAALSLVGLAGKGDRFPSELSGGMRRRVATARALLTNPDLLLFDEPTTGLDPVTKKSIENLLLVIKREVKITQLVVTHDMRLAFSLAERLSIIHNGRIIETGAPSEISASASPFVRGFLPEEGSPARSEA